MSYTDRRVRSYVFPALDGGTGLMLRGTSETEVLSGHLSAGGSLANLDLSGRMLRDLDLRHADLSGSRLRHADLRGCPVTFAKFDGADLSGADLAGIHGESPSFARATMGLHDGRGTVLDGSDIPGASFAGVVATGASFSKANLERADMTGLKAERCEFRGARIGNVEHARASYRACDFTKADLRSLSGANRRGVTRVNRTADTQAVSNTYEGTLMDDVVPAFGWDRRLSTVSKAVAIGLAGAAVAGGIAVGGHGLSLASEAFRHAVDTAALADRLAALTHYRDVTDLLYGTTLGRLAADNAGTIVAAVVSGAVLLKEKATGAVKDHLSGKVRTLIDMARPHVAEVARRIGNVSDVVAAFVGHPGKAAVLARGLSKTEGGAGLGFFGSACLGETTVLVCTGSHLSAAVEWLASGPGREGRIAHDVLLVRDRTGGDRDAAPVAVRLGADGGMTAYRSGPEGLSQRSWGASEMVADPSSPWANATMAPDGPDMARRDFLNAVLRDHLAGLDVEYVEGQGLVEFGRDGRVLVTGLVGSGKGRYEGAIDDEPAGPRM